MTRTLGIDIAGDLTRLVDGRLHKGAFEIQAVVEVPTDELGDAIRAYGFKGLPALVGVTGRDMILRTVQVPPVPAWQLRELMSFEIDEVAEQSGDALSADFGVLAGAAGYVDEDLVLLALVRNSLIEERTALMAAGAAGPAAFTPNAVALYNAFVAADGRAGTVMVASLGAVHTDIALVEDGELLFARNLAGGADVFVRAVQDAFGVDRAAAETALDRLGRFPRPGETLQGQAQVIATALEDSLRHVVGMLQSSVVLCRTQLQTRDVKPDAVLLCGSGTSLPGLDEALTRAMGMPVEFFDPTDGYVVGDLCEPDDALDHGGAAFGVAAGLAMMGALKDSYRIEILSDVARRRKQFLQRTIWLVAALVLVLAHLGLEAWVRQGDASVATRDLGKMKLAVVKRSSAVSDYERTVAAGREAAARLARLEDVAAPGAGMVVALDLLAAHLPEELWVTSVRTVRTIEADMPRGVERRPYVVVEGRGKEVSRNLADAVTELVRTLRGEPPIAAVLPQMSTDTRGEFTWELKLDTSVMPGADEDAEADGDELAGGLSAGELERPR